MALSFWYKLIIMLIMLIWLFVCLSSVHTCLGLARVAQQYNAGGREWPINVLNLFSPVKYFTPSEIYTSGGGLLIVPVNETYLYLANKLAWTRKKIKRHCFRHHVCCTNNFSAAAAEINSVPCIVTYSHM